MNNRNYDYPESVGPHVASLMAQMDVYIEDDAFRQQVRRSLQQLTDLKFALDQSSIVAITDRQGIIQYVNDKFCEVSQYARSELIGQDHRIINSGYHDKAFMRNLWQTIGSGKVWRGDIRNRAKNGSYYWVNTTIVPLLDPDGRPFQYLAVRTEVTRLKIVEEELKQMMTKVMMIQEEERKRFSRELHDGIGQSMFSLLIQVDRLLTKQATPELSALRNDLSFVMEDIRSLAWELRPSVLDDLGAVPAIRSYIENYSEHYGIEVAFVADKIGRLSIEKETAIFRVIQEALTNIARYADVSSAKVSIRENNSEVVVLIEDEGQGFQRETSRKGVGLFSMEERARGAGGKLNIHSEPGRGTTVELIIPLT